MVAVDCGSRWALACARLAVSPAEAGPQAPLCPPRHPYRPARASIPLLGGLAQPLQVSAALLNHSQTDGGPRYASSPGSATPPATDTPPRHLHATASRRAPIAALLHTHTALTHPGPPASQSLGLARGTRRVWAARRKTGKPWTLARPSGQPCRRPARDGDTIEQDGITGQAMGDVREGREVPGSCGDAPHCGLASTHTASPAAGRQTAKQRKSR